MLLIHKLFTIGEPFNYILTTLIPTALLTFMFSRLSHRLDQKSNIRKELIGICLSYNQELFEINQEYRKFIFGITPIEVRGMSTSVSVINSYCPSNVTLLKRNIERNRYFLKKLQEFHVNTSQLNNWLKSECTSNNFRDNVRSGQDAFADLQRQIKYK
ncbi:hypothetical protein [Convivina praedatoris]|uniref:hypothetical protein n=1 Tax=Convivina praedatoris TaxID=2880963 RepID=UPI00200FD767|nr:hypothetical protein [Convivina sp. LMG 32447]CAH1849936.1 hypothetical protein R078138_00027 [Convivina sp. LMG 32447]